MDIIVTSRLTNLLVIYSILAWREHRQLLSGRQ
jgi:hypothetical protein